ncbi:PREDICTED: complement factor H-related protein 3-like [Bison bison bison]|uniref:Complement factor H-related protein 3-like n=1 Tax=Bison bison bison TaxID=43346 RepID=A0A6P3GSY9_BISBB|nr:PREDICTED: complement factor H-related protein 3-like [Bison bison bison]
MWIQFSACSTGGNVWVLFLSRLPLDFTCGFISTCACESSTGVYSCGSTGRLECASGRTEYGGGAVAWIAGVLAVPETCSKYNITIENGFLSESASTYPLNKQTEYKCKSGYVTADGKTSGLITCLQNGWSSQPVCINSQGKCGPPPPIDNGDITSLLQSVYPPGMSVEYQCQAYYELQGNRNVVCQNGEWSEPPKCLEACVISEETMRKHHIQLRWKPDTKLYFKTEDNIEFMCQHGYHPVTPEHTFQTTCREGKVVYPSCGKNID